MIIIIILLKQTRLHRTQLESFINKAMLLYLFLCTKKHGQCRAFLFEMILYITLPTSLDAQTRRQKDTDIIELPLSEKYLKGQAH